MTELTLEELRGMAPEHGLDARLRHDASMMWGPSINSLKLDMESKPKRKRCLSALAHRFLRLSLRAS
jgi:hypothetical protein